MSTLRLPSKTFHAVHFMFVLLVLTVQGFPQTPTRVKASGSLRDELTHIPAETGMSVAIFDHGKLTTAPMGSRRMER
jgi:hypothetical protein